MVDQGVTAASATRDALRSTNGDDSHNSKTGVRRTERAARECTYTDFLKCQPLPFKGTEGVASLSQWCERMESVFHISNCTAENQVKFAMFAEEADKIEKYVEGLPDMIYGSVVASKPKTMQEAIEIATELMDKKVLTFDERATASKRKLENTSRTIRNQHQQQKQHSNKRQNTGWGNQGGRNNALARVYVVGCAGADPDANVVTGQSKRITPNSYEKNLRVYEREFWCTAIAYDLNPPADDYMVRPLKEYKI
nr:hypothetical protein [Tanacetum cinerariifolium]